jgi:hypothetical protein
MQSFIATLTLGLFALLAGCGKQDEVSPPPSRAPSTTYGSEVVADHWIGQWNGPEGTYLRISGINGRYEVTVMNLDGPRTFTGTATGNGIEFERDGVRESLRATDGQGTGMKWLAEKSECLVVRPGEGYCRG